MAKTSFNSADLYKAIEQGKAAGQRYLKNQTSTNRFKAETMIDLIACAALDVRAKVQEYGFKEFEIMMQDIPTEVLAAKIKEIDNALFEEVNNLLQSIQDYKRKQSDSTEDRTDSPEYIN